MTLTQKETELLKELQSSEKLCIEKYQKYSAQACDSNLKNLFTQLGQVEQGHLDTINQIMGGTVPSMSSSGANNQEQSPAPSTCSTDQKQQDKYLCTDALSTEKHVSSIYDTCIFEFKDKNIRNILNHIQKEEQEHGEKIYNYMELNQMYA